MWVGPHPATAEKCRLKIIELGQRIATSEVRVLARLLKISLKVAELKLRETSSPSLQLELKGPGQPHQKSGYGAAAFRDACVTIQRFQDQHKIPWLRIYKHYGFDNRYIEHWLAAGGKKLPRSIDVRNCLIEFAALIKKDYQSVLTKLGIGTVEVVSTNPVEIARAVADRNDSKDAYQRAAKLVDLGDTEKATTLLVREFSLQATKGFTAAAAMLPGMIYHGYRNMNYAPFAQIVRAVILPVLETTKPRMRLDDETRAACLVQLACLLNEGNDGPTASRLFNLPVARALYAAHTKKNFRYPWLIAQVLRNEAILSAVHEHNTPDAVAKSRDALSLNRKDPSNARSVALNLCSSYWMNSDHDTAWEAVEPQYNDWRNVLTSLVGRIDSQHPSKINDIWHACAPVFWGAIARCVADKPYPREDLAFDLRLLRWYAKRYGAVGLGVRMICQHLLRQSRLKSEFKEIIAFCLKSELVRDDRDAFYRLIDVLV
jgi:hypothetical protein